MQVTRLLAVAILWPMLSRTGYGLDWREGVVLVWAGLRGAVGLSLSLFVLLNRVGSLNIMHDLKGKRERGEPLTEL